MGNDLNNAAEAIDAFIKRLESSMKTAGHEIGKLLEDKVKSNIESQALPLHPLSEEWAKFKESHGLDIRTLISTGAMLNSINFVYRDSSDSVGDLVLDSEYAWLVLIHEFGAGHVPPRPFIVPSVHQIEKEAGIVLTKHVEKAIKG